MNNLENFDMRLELFLKNKMTEEESKVFLIELQNNLELRERAQAMAATIKNMKELRYEYGQQVTSKIGRLSEREFRNETKLPHKARIISIRIFAKMSMVACFIGIISFGTYRYYIYNETIALGNSYYSLIPTELVVRDVDNVSAQLAQLFNKVKNNEDLSNTIVNLEEKFSLAISKDFNDYTNYINDIGWNLAIAHLKDGNRDKAIEALELLILHSESDIVIEKCRKLINDIKQL
jgi:tetratricopeptide (TPR) repeat protein